MSDTRQSEASDDQRNIYHFFLARVGEEKRCWFKFYFFVYTCANDNVINTNEQVNDIQNGIQMEVLGLMLTLYHKVQSIRKGVIVFVIYSHTMLTRKYSFVLQQYAIF